MDDYDRGYLMALSDVHDAVFSNESPYFHEEELGYILDILSNLREAVDV